MVGAIALLVAGAGAAAAVEPIVPEAKNAILIDGATDTVLAARDPDTPFMPASLAKLMTLAVVFDEIEAGRLSLDETFKISLHAWRTGGAPARVSAMFARVNSQVSVRDLIRGVAITVGNDAAIALAEGIAGSEQAFAERMNAKAKALGLTRSHFVNATGLPAPGQRTTARDLAELARHLAADADLYGVFSEAELTWSKIRQRNRNPLITSFGGVDPYPGADGLMIGSVADFGHSIVASAQRDGKRLFAVLAGLPSEEERGEAARQLLERGFTGFVDRQLFAAGTVVAQATVYGGDRSRVSLVTAGAVHVPVPTDGEPQLVARVVYRGPLTAPIPEGKPVAVLKIWRDGLMQRELPLLAANAVGVGPLWHRAYDAAYELAVAAVAAVARRM
jgi:D-alanyl-D-alanine carboxypeptidase (penicillin-binding protein 5/6)